MKFDPKAFATENIHQAAAYSWQLANEGEPLKEFLPYFQENAATMDTPHLQLALYLLGRLDNEKAWQVLADYLHHPDLGVRFVATKMLKSTNFVNATVMKKIVSRLRSDPVDPLVRELAVLLDRAETVEAMIIAKEYGATLEKDRNSGLDFPTPSACIIGGLLPYKAQPLLFDPRRFESLSGADASLYAMHLAKEGLKAEDFLPYFLKNAVQMDISHLEVALFLLGNLDLPAAAHVVADYLDNNNFRVSFVAAKMIKRLDAADEIVMEKVVNCLHRADADPMRQGLKRELKDLLSKPANATARLIADNYLAQMNK